MNAIALFVTCFIDTIQPEAAQATVAVLERRGWAVEFPADQTCCGQFSYNAGYRGEAAKMARHWLETFEQTAGPIVALSGSCAAMVIHDYPALLWDQVLSAGGTETQAQQWKDRAERVASRVFELSQWLDRPANEGPTAHTAPAATEDPPRVRVIYHVGCHMRRVLPAQQEAQTVLRKLGIDLVEPEDGDQCCGFGGTYSMTEPAISTALADAKWAAIHRQAEAEGASVLASADMGCLLHLRGRASRLGAGFATQYLGELVDWADRRQSESGAAADVAAERSPNAGHPGEVRP